MKKSNNNMPIVFYVGLLLVCLTFFSVHMSSGLYARYASSATGSSSARVARLDMSHLVVTQDASIDASIALNFFDPAEFSDSVVLCVTSDSEVAMKYDVIVTLPAGVDYDWLSVELELDGGTVVGSVDENVITFTEVGKFSPSDDTVKEHTLYFSIIDTFYGNSMGLPDMNGDVQITVHAEQID